MGVCVRLPDAGPITTVRSTPISSGPAGIGFIKANWVRTVEIKTRR